ncbi:MAG: ATP-binding protein [Erysipelotrichaceae bacterium]|nr:ATP-binding protein [Erysipelotrichaceae bacterium]
MIIKRDRYLQKLIDRRHSSYIKIITGIRRCGKSYLLKTLYYNYLLSQGINKDQIIIVELDDDRFEDIRDKKELRQYIETKASDNGRQYYIFIDEVQIVKDFEGTVISLNNHDNYDVYITGSNSEFLSSDISTRFKDRGSEIRIHPLSYDEYYSAYQDDKRFALRDYLTYGGMPRLFDEKTEADKISYLNNLINRTYLSDVVERNKVRLPEEMSSLFDLLCSTTGSLVSPNSIAGTLRADKHIRIDDETVFAYIQHLEDAFIFEKARRYNIKGKEYLKTPFKLYPEDVGLRNARINFRQQDKGFGIENVVYNELRTRGYAVDVGLLETRERNAEGKQIYKQNEVDFIARFASKEYYIQIMDETPEGRHGNNEFSNLIKVPGSFKKVAIINTPFKSYTDENGILIISLEEFLIDQNSLNL